MTVTAPDSPEGPLRGRLWIACAITVLAVVGAHGGIGDAQLLTFDDLLYVTGNPQVQGGLTADGFRWAFRTDQPRTYFHPLTWLSLMADRELFGPGPFGFHAVNVALHAVAAVLLLLALSRATGRLLPSLAAVILFAVHPLTVESVMWVAERKTVLSGALGFGALVAYVAYARAPSRRRMAIVALLFGSSLLAKPGLVLLPVLMLVLDFWPLGRLRLPGAEHRAAPGWRPPGRLLAEKVPLAALSAASLAISILSVQRAIQQGPPPPSFTVRLANALATLPEYLRAAFWPSDLSVFHPYPATVPAASVVAGVALLVTISAVAVATAARRPWILAGCCWFLVALVPYLGFMQAGLWPAWADRFMYVPLVGIAVAVAFEAAELAGRARAHRLAALAAVAAATALGVATRAQGAHWRTSEALYRRAVAIEPRSAVMHFNLGTEFATTGRHAEARRHLGAAIDLAGSYPDAQAQLGAVAAAQGRLAEAEAHQRKALEGNPNHKEALYNLAHLLRWQGRSRDALPYFARFLQVTGPKEHAAQRAVAEAALAAGR